MDFCENYEKINLPMYICTPDWNIIYRNKACKRYTKTPRLHTDLSTCFVDGKNVKASTEDGDFVFVVCLINGCYKTALCFEYDANIVVLFPQIFDFDILFSEIMEETKFDFSQTLRELFTYIPKTDISKYDKYGFFDKIRKYTYSVIDNQVTLSLLSGENRAIGSFNQIYGFIDSHILSNAKKAGYKVTADYSRLLETGDMLYTDTAFFSMVMSELLFFCLSVSDDKKAEIVADSLGNKVKNTVKFTYKSIKNNTESGDTINDILWENPIEYLNFSPFEELCKSLGWCFEYIKTDDDNFNVEISFTIDNDNKAVFRSAGKQKIEDIKEIMSKIFSKIMGI